MIEIGNLGSRQQTQVTLRHCNFAGTRQSPCPNDVLGQGGAAEPGVVIAADAVSDDMGDRCAIAVVFQPPGHGTETTGHGASIHDQQDGQTQAAGQLGRARFAVVQTHHAFDENQVRLRRGTRQPPAGIRLTAHAKVDVLAVGTAGQGMDLRVEEIGAALEHAHLAPQPPVQARQRRHHRRLAVAGCRRGNQQGRRGYHSTPGMA